MSSTPSAKLDSALVEQIRSQVPYSYLPEVLFASWMSQASLRRCNIGQRFLRPNELSSEIFLLLSGEVRLLGEDPLGQGPITVAKRGPGQLLGWSSLLRAGPCEWISAVEPCDLLCLPAAEFVTAVKDCRQFFDYFASVPGIQEAYHTALKSASLTPHRKKDWQKDIISRSTNAFCCTLQSDVAFKPPIGLPDGLNWHLSTENVPGWPVGSLITPGDQLPLTPGLQFDYRCIGFAPTKAFPEPSQQLKHNLSELTSDRPAVSLEHLGIVEHESRKDSDLYPTCRGRGDLQEAMAICQMISMVHRVPFREDGVRKALSGYFKRNKSLSIELLANVFEAMGLKTQIAEIDVVHIMSIEFPAIFFIDEIPVVLHGSNGQHLILGHPHFGLIRKTISELSENSTSRIRFVNTKRSESTTTSHFGWSWFTPLLAKYKLALALVFAASLLAQLFGLAIPLLIQQIIDKVLSQGNLSSLNVLGTAMIVMALFQGILTALRTYIFVDTTDRMDLTLGSSVIDRLLSLPLNYFEKRPVGELSQRLGELNNIRGFLTGTALTSVLSIIFSVLYLVVMLVYSPLLSAVALSTLPIYFIIVFGVAPIYKSLIRRKAVAQARTQSHLIEIISGIQTVKAQHFELTARWKWQDRYRDFVNEGFKSVALGATASEVGKFLNQLSGLLVLWVGMWLVLKGEFTLGMLIAFRIISGNVTGPLLQLAGLYQGFQSVQLSMERLSDIVDQNPEMIANGASQIPLPPIIGDVRFENVRFRFGKVGTYQVDNLSVSIEAGDYVGIVGQSGSGKSTLMKLLARLYSLEEGRIFIDDYDIAKVDLSSLRRQVGIVPQDSLLFEGTIAENIALNDTNASTDSIIEAAKIACAHDFIMNLEDGYATHIAERGGNLSGGQRQRIAIARTILSNPRLLVLDEATSALDYNTERKLCKNLQKWSDTRTVFFITHRLSTIQNSDLILLMDDGRLSESGSHTELMERKALYASLYKQQSN